jgi:hypothetical protein
LGKSVRKMKSLDLMGNKNKNKNREGDKESREEA